MLLYIYILDTTYSARNSVENVGLMGFLTIIQNFVLPCDLISGIIYFLQMNFDAHWTCQYTFYIFSRFFVLPFNPLDCGLNQDISTILDSNLTKDSMGQVFNI